MFHSGVTISTPRGLNTNIGYPETFNNNPLLMGTGTYSNSFEGNNTTTLNNNNNTANTYSLTAALADSN